MDFGRLQGTVRRQVAPEQLAAFLEILAYAVVLDHVLGRHRGGLERLDRLRRLGALVDSFRERGAGARELRVERRILVRLHRDVILEHHFA